MGTNLRVAVIGDLQRTDLWEVWREQNKIHSQLMQQVADECPDALILLGDQVFTGSSSEDWKFFGFPSESFTETLASGTTSGNP